jgi:Ca2+-transporting ATPase
MKVEDFVLGMDADLDKGLSTELAEKRLNQYGKNKFTPPKKENIISQIIDNLKEPMIFILLLCGVISLFLGGKWYDTAGIFVAVLIATTIAIIQEGRAANTFEMLIKLSSNIKVKALRDDKVIQIAKEDITV